MSEKTRLTEQEIGARVMCALLSNPNYTGATIDDDASLRLVATAKGIGKIFVNFEDIIKQRESE